MNKEIIKKLLNSPSLEDNRLGYFFLKDFPFEEFLEMFNAHKSANNGVMISYSRGLDRRPAEAYKIKEDLYVHDQTNEGFFYRKSWEWVKYEEL